MSAGDLLLLLLGAALVTAGLYVIARRSRLRRGLARVEGDALARSSLLNEDRVDRVNASRATQGGQWIDRARLAFFGIWLITVGAVAILSALD
jgi:hypothetical protein